MTEEQPPDNERDGKGEVKGDELPSWNLILPKGLASRSLIELIGASKQRPVPLGQGDTARMAIHVAPTGFRGIMGSLAYDYRVSYSRLALLAAAHGTERFKDDPDIVALKEAYQSTHSAAMSRGDRDALARLNQTATHDFQHSQKMRTTITILRTTEARLSDLAMACGIAPNHILVLAIIGSLLTLPNARRYRNDLEDELAAFRRLVIHRRRVLLLGP